MFLAEVTPSANQLFIPGFSDETRVQRLIHPQSQHLADSGQSLSCEHDCWVISAGHFSGSDTYGHTPGRTKNSCHNPVNHWNGNQQPTMHLKKTTVGQSTKSNPCNRWQVRQRSKTQLAVVFGSPYDLLRKQFLCFYWLIGLHKCSEPVTELGKHVVNT